MHRKIDWFLDELGERERVEYVRGVFNVAESLHEQYGVNSDSKKNLDDERKFFDKGIKECRKEKRIKLYGDYNIVDSTLINLAGYLFDFVSQKEGPRVANSFYNAVIDGKIVGEVYNTVMDKKIDNIRQLLEDVRETRQRE